MQSLARFLHHEYFGEKTTKTFTNLIKCIDLVPCTAVKSGSVADLKDQYELFAKLLGLTMPELYAINLENLVKHTILHMVENNHNPNTVLQVGVHSSFTATEIYGETGMDKYSKRGCTYYMTQCIATHFRLHPQALMMGMNKSKRYSPEMRTKMNASFLRCYRAVVGMPDNIVFTSNVMDSFGNKWIDSDIKVGVLSHLAKKVAHSNAWGNPGSVLNEAALAVYNSQLEIHGTKKLNDLLLRFRAGHQMNTLAAQLGPNNSVSSELSTKIQEIEGILRKKSIMGRLIRLRKSQDKNGERLGEQSGLMNHLAAQLRPDGSMPSAMKEDLAKFVALSKGGKEGAMQPLRNTKPAQYKGRKRLRLQNELTNQIRSVDSETKWKSIMDIVERDPSAVETLKDGTRVLVMTRAKDKVLHGYIKDTLRKLDKNDWRMDVAKEANVNLIRYDDAMAQKREREVSDQDERQNDAMQALLMRSKCTRIN